MTPNKTPNDYTQIKFRPGAESALESALIERVDIQSDRAFSRVAKRDLERYYSALLSALPVFSEQEAIWLVDALNGRSNVVPERLYQEVRNSFADDMTPDQKKLVNFLRNLPIYAATSVLDAVERFWQGAYGKSADEMAAKLREVGLIR